MVDILAVLVLGITLREITNYNHTPISLSSLFCSVCVSVFLCGAYMKLEHKEVRNETANRYKDNLVTTLE